MKKNIIIALMFIGVTLSLIGCNTSKEELTTNSDETEVDFTENIKQYTVDGVANAECFSYTVDDENQEVTIDFFDKKGELKDVVVPDTIEGYPVTIIGTNAFREDSTIESVTLPITVREIGSYAFMSCESLTELNGTDNVVDYGEYSIEGTAINKLALSPDVVSLGEKALCTENSTLDVGENLVLNSITTLESHALSGVTCKSITLPSSLLVCNAVSICDNLESVIISEGTVTLTESAFAYCENLKTITIPASVTSIADSVLEEDENVTIIAPAGSAAETFANDKGIKFQAQ